MARDVGEITTCPIRHMARLRVTVGLEVRKTWMRSALNTAGTLYMGLAHSTYEGSRHVAREEAYVQDVLVA